jgi:hypothetical protein
MGEHPHIMGEVTSIYTFNCVFERSTINYLYKNKPKLIYIPIYNGELWRKEEKAKGEVKHGRTNSKSSDRRVFKGIWKASKERKGGDSEMKCKCAEVEFKSTPAAYWIEKKGDKNHTERLLTLKEVEWIEKHKVKTIIIRNSADPTMFYFSRKVTNIFKEGDILGHYLYSFTWKHEEKVQK